MKSQQQQQHVSSSSSSSSSSLQQQQQQLNENNNSINNSSKDNNIRSMYDTLLTCIFDIPIIDTYLLNTYIIPSIIDIIQTVVWYNNNQHKVTTSATNTTTSTSANDTSSSSTTTTTYIQKRIIYCCISILTILYTNGCTPAMQQLGIQLQQPSQQHVRSSKSRKSIVSFRTRLILYSLLQYILPDISIYILHSIQHYINTMIERINSKILLLLHHHNTTTNNNMNNNNTNNNMNHTRSILALQRQYNILIYIQQCITKYSTISNIIIQPIIVPLFTFIYIYWKNYYQKQHTIQQQQQQQPYIVSNINMILTGLQYQYQQHQHQQDDQPFQHHNFHVTFAYQRWMTFYLWETIRILLMNNFRLQITTTENMNHNTVSSIITSTTRRIKQYIHYQCSYYKYQLLSLVLFLRNIRIPFTTINTTTSSRSSNTNNCVPNESDDSYIPLLNNDMNMKNTLLTNQNHNNKTTTSTTTICPICQQVPMTMIIQTTCQQCHYQQIYCYTCFYNHFINVNNCNIICINSTTTTTSTSNTTTNDVSLSSSTTTYPNSLLRKEHHRQQYIIRSNNKKHKQQQSLYCLQCHSPIYKVRMI